ncbi:MAG: hypothetical protein K8S18_16690 [Desulfobacula sp.]|nr:hypothetical protein [Desulfobacula sp.]
MKEIFTRVSNTDFKAIYQLHKSYTGERRSIYVWEWEYGKKNPYISILVGVKVDNRYIATQGMYCINLCNNNNIELTGKNESLLIDEKFRGSGLSTRLYNYAISEYSKEEITCLWGFSRKAVVPLQKANFRVYFDVIERAVLSLSYCNSLKLVTAKGGNKYEQILNGLKAIGGSFYSKMLFSFFKKSINLNNNEFEFRSKMKSPNDIVNLFYNIKIKHPDIIHIHQDYEYFNWRIEKSPLDIEKIFLYNEDELLGYLFLTFYPDYCEITDFTFCDKYAGEIMTRKIANIISEKEIKFIYYTYNSKNVLNITILSQLKKIGFISTRGPNHFVLRNFKHDKSNVFFNIDRWYINSLWSEGI